MHKRLSHLLHGEAPSTLWLGLTYGAGLAGAVIAFVLADGWVLSLVLAAMAFDWSGGVVANLTSSTRRYWANLPLPWAVGFVLVHAAEVPVFLWLAGGDPRLWFLLGVLLVKVAVFVIGQAKFR